MQKSAVVKSLDGKIKELTVYIVLLPETGVKHFSIHVRKVKIKSSDFHGCSELDFLEKCEKLFAKFCVSRLHYIFDKTGQIIHKLNEIENQKVLFVKRDPKIDLKEGEIKYITTTLKRQMREV